MLAVQCSEVQEGRRLQPGDSHQVTGKTRRGQRRARGKQEGTEGGVQERGSDQQLGSGRQV